MNIPSFGLPDPKTLEKLNSLCRSFIVASFIYFGVGVLYGICLLHRLPYLSSFAHAHLNLIGFVGFLIFGIGYKLVPTMFAAKTAPFSMKLGFIQLYLAHLGIIGMVFFDLLRNLSINFAFHGLLISGVVEAISCYLFIYNMIRTVL